MHLSSTVFLIAKDTAVRDALSISLTMDCLKIEGYLTGDAFLQVYTENRPGCVLMDLSEAELGRLVVQQELIRRNLPIPLIFLTDIGTKQKARLALKSGAFCVLEKPVQRSLLLERIHAAMNQDHQNCS